MKKLFTIVFLITIQVILAQQKSSISGLVTLDKKAVIYANIQLVGTPFKTETDSLGNYTLENIPDGNYKMLVSAIEVQPLKKNIF